MMVFQNAAGEKTIGKSQASDLPMQQSGLNPALLASLASPNVQSLSLASYNTIKSASLPLGYPLDFSSGVPPSLQAQILMGRPFLNPFSGMSNPTSLAPLAAGIQTLQAANASMLPNLPVPRGRPDATEIKSALAISTAAISPEGSAAPLNPTPDNAESTKEASLPVVVFMDCDEESLSDYQCILRKQIELFEASTNDVQWNAQGRNKPIVPGQVGIRCRWCANLPAWSRSRGSIYYSATLDGLYQAAQNMAKNHICKNCRYIPVDIRQDLVNLRECKRRAAGGKAYWAEGAKVLGIYQSEDGLRFKNSKIPAPTTSNNSIAIKE